MTLNTIESIHSRYSCRAFTDKMPSDNDLQLIAEAAIAAPSGMNRQPWQIIVVKNKELLAELEAEGIKNLMASPDQSVYERIMSRGGQLYYNTPCQIIVAINKSAPTGYEPYDCGMVVQNITLAATSLGIESLICGLATFSFAGEKGVEFKRRLAFAEGYELGLSVLVGYAKVPGGKPHQPDPSKITVIE